MISLVYIHLCIKELFLYLTQYQKVLLITTIPVLLPNQIVYLNLLFEFGSIIFNLRIKASHHQNIKAILKTDSTFYAHFRQLEHITKLAISGVTLTEPHRCELIQIHRVQ